MGVLSVSEAAEHLGVSRRQVRRLAAQGSLPSHQISGTWIIDAEAVRARARGPLRVGRPVSGAMAWLLLATVAEVMGDDSLAERTAALADRRVRHRVRHLLRGCPPARQWDDWLRNRGQVHRLWVHPGLVSRLCDDARLHSSPGPVPGTAPPAYLAEADLGPVVDEYHLRSSEDGSILLRSVSDELAGWVLGAAGQPLPEVVGLIDALSSPDARTRHAAGGALASAIDDVIALPATVRR